MGDRVVYTLKQSDGKELSLYSHWGGYTRFKDLAYAIGKAQPRWNDESYCARIIISQLIGNQWDSETGFGLWAGSDNGASEYDPITIHLDYKTVEYEGNYKTFDEFITYNEGV